MAELRKTVDYPSESQNVDENAECPGFAMKLHPDLFYALLTGVNRSTRPRDGLQRRPIGCPWITPAATALGWFSH